MTTVARTATSPSAAGAAILTGHAVTDSGTATSQISDTDQATTQAVYTLGIALQDCAAGDIPTIAVAGDEIPFVASGAVAIGDLLVAKYSATASVAGALMAVTSHLTGDVIVGICTKGAADTKTGMCRFVGHPTK